MLKRIGFWIKSQTRHVQCNGQLADPACPYTIEIKKLTKKMNKTPEDHKMIEDLEWEGGLYLNAEKKVVIPGSMIVGAIAQAARLSREGKDVRSGLSSEGMWPLKYRGPQDVNELKVDPAFRLRTTVIVNKKSRVVRTRPMFSDWELYFETLSRPDIVGADQVVEFVRVLGHRIGLSEDRAIMGGRFELTKHKELN